MELLKRVNSLVFLKRVYIPHYNDIKGHLPSSERLWARHVPMHCTCACMARQMRDCAMTRRSAAAGYSHHEYINHDINGTMTFEFIETIETLKRLKRLPPLSILKLLERCSNRFKMVNDV